MTQNPKQDRHPYEPTDETKTAQAAQGQQTDASQPGEPPKQELPTIAQAKRAVCDKLTQIFTSPLMNERLMKMAGGDASRVAKNLTAFLMLITQHDGGSANKRKYLHQCSITSLTTCFLESMNMQLPFDSRQLVSIVIYDWEAELDISYKGFINALNKHYKDAYVDAKLVFNDDLFECSESGGKAVFKHEAKDPFATVQQDFKNIKGGYCYFSYTTETGEPISRIVRMSRDDLIHIKSKAKTKNVWNEFPSEMGIKALIRRGSKIPFAAIDLDIDIEEVANRHFELDKPGSGNRLKLLMAAQEETTHAKSDDVRNDANTTKPGDDNAKPETQDESKNPPKEDASVDNGAGTDPQSASPTNRDEYMASAEKPEHDAGISDVHAGHVTEAKYEETKLPSDPTVWDGRTVYTGDGKSAVKDFATAQAALVYVKRVVSQRKHKPSRMDIIKGNDRLIAALIKDGDGAAVAELHQLADAGE